MDTKHRYLRHRATQNPGVLGKDVAWIPQNKVKHFKTLFNEIRLEVGTYEGARDFIGLAAGTLDMLEKGKVTARTAKLIFVAWEKIKKSKKAVK